MVKYDCDSFILIPQKSRVLNCDTLKITNLRYVKYFSKVNLYNICRKISCYLSLYKFNDEVLFWRQSPILSRQMFCYFHNFTVHFWTVANNCCNCKNCITMMATTCSFAFVFNASTNPVFTLSNWKKCTGCPNHMSLILSHCYS